MKKRDRIFKNFLKSFFGNNDKNIKTVREIVMKIICFNINKIEYSVPIREQIARIPINDKMNGIMNSFFDKIYQLAPNKLLSSLKSIFFNINFFLLVD